MNITKKKLERLLRDAFDAGRFGVDCAERERDFMKLRAQYVRCEIDKVTNDAKS